MTLEEKLRAWAADGCACDQCALLIEAADANRELVEGLKITARRLEIADVPGRWVNEARALIAKMEGR